DLGESAAGVHGGRGRRGPRRSDLQVAISRSGDRSYGLVGRIATWRSLLRVRRRIATWRSLLRGPSKQLQLLSNLGIFSRWRRRGAGLITARLATRSGGYQEHALEERREPCSRDLGFRCCWAQCGRLDIWQPRKPPLQRSRRV